MEPQNADCIPLETIDSYFYNEEKNSKILRYTWAWLRWVGDISHIPINQTCVWPTMVVVVIVMLRILFSSSIGITSLIKTCFVISVD